MSLPRKAAALYHRTTIFIPPRKSELWLISWRWMSTFRIFRLYFRQLMFLHSILSLCSRSPDNDRRVGMRPFSIGSENVECKVHPPTRRAAIPVEVAITTLCRSANSLRICSTRSFRVRLLPLPAPPVMNKRSGESVQSLFPSFWLTNEKNPFWSIFKGQYLSKSLHLS